MAVQTRWAQSSGMAGMRAISRSKASASITGPQPRFLAQLVLELANGQTQTVVSDASWKASCGPIQFGDLLLGSGYDARLDMPGWNTTNFNDTSWSPVSVGLSAAAVGYSNVTAIVAGLVSKTASTLSRTTPLWAAIRPMASSNSANQFHARAPNRTQSFAEDSR